MSKNEWNKVEMLPEGDEHCLREGFFRFKCKKCGWYIDLQEKFMENFKSHYTGIDCSECGFPVIRWK